MATRRRAPTGSGSTRGGRHRLTVSFRGGGPHRSSTTIGTSSHDAHGVTETTEGRFEKTRDGQRERDDPDTPRNQRRRASEPGTLRRAARRRRSGDAQAGHISAGVDDADCRRRPFRDRYGGPRLRMKRSHPHTTARSCLLLTSAGLSSRLGNPALSVAYQRSSCTSSSSGLRPPGRFGAVRTDESAG